MDMTGGYAASARNHVPHAATCIDPHHVVQLAKGAGRGPPSVPERAARGRRPGRPTNARRGPALLTRETLKEAVRGIFEPGLSHGESRS